MFDKNIFNVDKQSYHKTPLFLGEQPALFDTINKSHPGIWDIYKKMRSLDWDENEFDFSPCNKDFKSCSKSVYDMMIKTLAWQWEADSVAGRSIGPIVAPFVSSSELWAAWSRITENELLHAATYSEIVRNSFDDPNEVVNEVLSVRESLARLNTVASIMSNTHRVSHRLALGMIDRDSDEAYSAILMFVIALFVLERIQFMSSFAITFAIADTGLFLPIGKAVQKIAQDEFEVHVELGKEILRTELKTERGITSFMNNRDKIKTLIDEVVQSELNWNEYAFSEGRELAGLTSEYLSKWTLFNAGDVYSFLNIETDHQIPHKNPLSFMDDWLIISRTQTSPQEEKTGQYMVGMVVDTAGTKEFNIDF